MKYLIHQSTTNQHFILKNLIKISNFPIFLIVFTAAVLLTACDDFDPEITSFKASPSIIAEGDAAELIAKFSDGSSSIDNGVGPVISGEPKMVSPLETTTFTLTVSNREGAEVARTTTVVVKTNPIALTIISPSNNQLVNNELEISATIQSDIDIASVTASVNEQSTYLIHSAEAICSRTSCTPGFSGQMELDGLPPGPHVLTVTAVDVEGNSTSKKHTIELDKKPILTISEPLDLSVARPKIPLDISCIDDIDDCEISVSVQSSTLATSVNVLSETLDLSAYNGQQITLKIEGKDGSNQRPFKSVVIFVEASERLENVKEFTGQVVDFDGRQALILTHGDEGESLSIHDIESDTITNVYVPDGLTISPSQSFLTPTGAIYSGRPIGTNVLSQRVYDWNNSLLYEHGKINSALSLSTAGDYAIWNEGSNLWRRKFSTTTSSRISTQAGNWKNAVANNGVVAYWTSNYTIQKYDSGIVTTLAVDDYLWNTYVISDGVQFVYRKSDPCCNDQSYAIAYHDGFDETVLTNFSEREPDPGYNYQINSGWIAFTELGGLGQHHVWTRDPAGALLQRTVFGSDSYISALSSDGELMLLNSGKRYLSNTTGQLTEVGSALGITTKIDGVWYVSIGRLLLKMR